MEGFYYVSTQNAQLAQNSKVFEVLLVLDNL